MSTPTPSPFFDVRNLRTGEVIASLQAASFTQAGVRALALTALCAGAHWLRAHENDGYDLYPHPPGEPFGWPVFGDGWFEALNDYVSDTLAAPRTPH